MRIIGGKFKGKKIFEPKDKVTRPLKDLVKESIFNVINHSNKFSISLKNSKILDIFSGVGSFGIEAISRGASSTFFVENYPSVIHILMKNIKNLDLIKNCKVIEKDVFKELNFEELDQNFDLIFLDPPFKEKKLSTLLIKINQSKILKPQGLIIIHRHRKEKDLFPENLIILETKKYGLSKIFFCKYS